MEKEGIQLNFSTNSITIQKSKLNPTSVPFISDICTKTAFAKTFTGHVVPPHSEYALTLKVNKFEDGDVVLCEPPKHLEKDELAGGKCLSVVLNGKVLYRVMNPTAVPIFITQNSTVSVISEVIPKTIKTVASHQNDMHCKENLPFISSISTNNLSDEQYIKIAQDLGINLEDADLTTEQKRKLLVFIGQNRKSFAKDFSELGVTNLHYHRIETGDHKPIKKAPYRQSPAMRRETERQVTEMLENGIIQESDSPWNSPVVLVKKKSGEWRFAVDYRELNKVTEPMSFPLPHLSDVFDTIADAKAEEWFLAGTSGPRDCP